jgi:hypothetical protein
MLRKLYLFEIITSIYIHPLTYNIHGIRAVDRTTKQIDYDFNKID